MIIACPECKTRFIVPPQAIGKQGRMVKCSSCEHTWFQDPPEEDVEIVPVKVVEEEKGSVTQKPQKAETKNSREEKVKPGEEPLRKNVPALIKEKGRGVIIGWIGLAVFLAGFAFSIYFFRDFFEEKSEFAETLYEKWDAFYNPPVPEEPEQLPPIIVTEPHPASFLNMRQSVEVRYENEQPNLVIFLDIQNTGTKDVRLPDLQGVIRDETGEELFTWRQTLEPSVVPAGGFQQYEIFVETIRTSSRQAEVWFDWEEKT